MRYNGVDIKQAHHALSVDSETPPGMPTRTNHMLQGTDGEIYAGSSMERGEYTVLVNIAGKTRQEAWEARAMLAQWANSSGGKTAPLEPSWWPGMAYDAIISSIEPPKFVRGFARKIKVVFEIPRPVAHEMITSKSTGVGKLILHIGGTSFARPTIRQTMLTDAEELVWTMEGKAFFALATALHAGDTVEADFADGWVTINGEHREADIDFVRTRWEPGFTPGAKTVTSSDTGAMEARWHNEWL